MEDKVRKELEERGAVVLTTLHALGDDVNTAFAINQGVAAFNAVVAETLRRFSQGMKVCVEIVLMAAENGAINVDREVIAIAGTNEGADTAVVIKPCYARKFLDLEIREILEPNIKIKQRRWARVTPGFDFPEAPLPWQLCCSLYLLLPERKW